MQPWLSWRVDELPINEAGLSWGVLLAAGLLYCFLGYRLFRLVLGLTGFLVAGGVAAGLAGWASQGNVVAMAVAGVLGGLCGAVALSFLYRVGVFFVGFLGVLLVAYTVLQGIETPWRPWIVVGLAVLGGLLALWIERPVMTMATAVIGAWLASWSSYFLLLQTRLADRVSDPEFAARAVWAVWGGFAVLTALGAAFQFSTRPASPPKK